MDTEFKKRILTSLLIIPFSLFFIIQGSLFFLIFLIFFLTISVYEWLNMNKNKLVKFIGVIYLLFTFYFTYLLRTDAGLSAFLLILLICVFTDLGGYTFGKLFKGPKLTKISPKKTYAGVYGGIIFSIIAGLVYVKYQTFFGILKTSFFLENNFNLILIILLISVISQIGDLVISYFKRLSKIKNTGNLLPGHGGILDRIDGIIFAIPFSYALLTYL